MTASSTQGVGQGISASQKGATNVTLGTTHLIGARVVDAGSVALTSASPSVATVTFAKTLSGSASNYIVMAVPVGATAAIAAAGVAVSALTTASFVLTGPNSVTTTIYWVLIKIT